MQEVLRNDRRGTNTVGRLQQSTWASPRQCQMTAASKQKSTEHVDTQPKGSPPVPDCARPAHGRLSPLPGSSRPRPGPGRPFQLWKLSPLIIHWASTVCPCGGSLAITVPPPLPPLLSVHLPEPSQLTNHPAQLLELFPICKWSREAHRSPHREGPRRCVLPWAGVQHRAVCHPWPQDTWVF